MKLFNWINDHAYYIGLLATTDHLEVFETSCFQKYIIPNIRDHSDLTVSSKYFTFIMKKGKAAS